MMNLHSNSNSNSDSNSESININLDSTQTSAPKSYEELQKEKAEYIRLLERLEQKIHAHKKFTMTSDYNEVKMEYDRLNRQENVTKV